MLQVRRQRWRGKGGQAGNVDVECVFVFFGRLPTGVLEIAIVNFIVVMHQLIVLRFTELFISLKSIQIETVPDAPHSFILVVINSAIEFRC